MDREFFLTTDGYMGMYPPEMAFRNSITLLSCSKVPFCIRAVQYAQQGYYRIVGDTYVHDLMDREDTIHGWGDGIVQIHLYRADPPATWSREGQNFICG